MVRRVIDATNAHDLEALTACFAADYVNETPAHPARGFQGRDQVCRNWQQIFGAVPDVRVTARTAVDPDGSTVWSEWSMTGTRLDGSSHHMAGVIICQSPVLSLPSSSDWGRHTSFWSASNTPPLATS